MSNNGWGTYSYLFVRKYLLCAKVNIESTMYEIFLFICLRHFDYFYIWRLSSGHMRMIHDGKTNYCFLGMKCSWHLGRTLLSKFKEPQYKSGYSRLLCYKNNYLYYKGWSTIPYEKKKLRYRPFIFRKRRPKTGIIFHFINWKFIWLVW